jgi:hypothetical protein
VSHNSIPPYKMFVNFSYVFGSHLISANIPLLKQKKGILHLCLKSGQELRPISLGLKFPSTPQN